MKSFVIVGVVAVEPGQFSLIKIIARLFIHVHVRIMQNILICIVMSLYIPGLLVRKRLIF